MAEGATENTEIAEMKEKIDLILMMIYLETENDFFSEFSVNSVAS